MTVPTKAAQYLKGNERDRQGRQTARNPRAPQSFHFARSSPAQRFRTTTARETEPVRPVPLAQVEAVLPFLSRQVKAMVRLQLVTGARGGELCSIRTCDLDTTGEVWTYKPAKHKTSHRDIERVIRFGPKGKEILAPMLKTDVQAFIFSPADAEAERRAAMTKKRREEEGRTPPHIGNRPGTNRKRDARARR